MNGGQTADLLLRTQLLTLIQTHRENGNVKMIRSIEMAMRQHSHIPIDPSDSAIKHEFRDSHTEPNIHASFH